MTLREFLRHKIPLREVIVGQYHQISRLQQDGERKGVVIRHGFEHLRWAYMPLYEQDESYPPQRLINAEAIPIGFRELYVVNCASTDRSVTALPKGVAPFYHPWRLAAAKPHRVKTKLAYCNFSLGNPTQPLYTRKRKEVLGTLSGKTWITFENVSNEFGHYDLSQLDYYRRVADHRFTISPEGNGVDCHRTWEALYLKSVPIVQNSVEMSHFKDLPMLFTDDYSELTPQYLEAEYRRMLDTDYRIEKLYISFWRRRIEASIRRAREPIPHRFRTAR